MTRELPGPSAAHLLMRERLTALRALYLGQGSAARGTAAALRQKAVRAMTREQIVAAILAAREQR